MNNAFPPPGPAGPLDRLGAWMRKSKLRQWLVLTLVWLAGFMILFPAWIAVAILRDSTERDAGAVALNLVVVFALSIVCLIATHRAMYRSFRHIDRRRANGTLRPGDPDPAYGSEPTEPAPRMDWPWTLRLRHALIYLIGIATLLYAFAPYRNQRAIVYFLIAHSTGRTSAGSLSILIFGYLPMGLLMMLAMLLTYRQLGRRDAGLLDERERWLLEAEISWLFSFVAAFTFTVFLCRWAGGMIVAFL